VVLGNINSNSPLVFDGRMLGALREFAGANQGRSSCRVLAGAMGPVTAAGCLAEILAETMAGMALTRSCAGAPVIFGSFVGAISMRTGAPTFGTPEATQMIFATAQLARRLGVPCRSAARCAPRRSRCPGRLRERAHAAADAARRGQPRHHAAGWLEGGLVAGYEKFVMDADQLAMMQALSQGWTCRRAGKRSTRCVNGSRQPLSRMLAHAGELKRRLPIYDPDYSSYEQWSMEGPPVREPGANSVEEGCWPQYQDPGMILQPTKRCSLHRRAQASSRRRGGRRVGLVLRR